MKIKDLKVGQIVETKAGTGKVVRVGGTFPPSVQVDITEPFPRGVVNVSPRDVLRVVSTSSSST